MRKFGLHLHSTVGAAKVVDFCRRVQPVCMKSISPDRALIEQCRAVSPGTIWIGRVVWNPQTLEAYTVFQDATLTRARELKGVVDRWEGMNEWGDKEHTRDFMQKECGLARRLMDMGLGANIGGFSTGFIDGDLFDKMNTTWELITKYPDKVWLHFHEYSAPYLGYMARTADGKNQWDHAGNRFTGPSTDRRQFDDAPDGWLTLRYRMLRKRLVDAGITNVRFFISEFGIDGGVNPRPGPQGGGWKDFQQPEWMVVQGDFAEQVAWYVQQLTRDPYVVGAVDFGAGTLDPRWNSWDILADDANQMRERLIAALVKLPGPAPIPIPVEPGGDAMLKGVDVSTYQGAIDWAKMKAAGVQYAWIRAGGGTGQADGRFKTNAAGAGGAKIAWGPYWWYSQKLDPIDQAEAFAAAVQQTMFVLPPAVDLERDDGPVAEAHLRAFIDTVEKRIGRPVVYTSHAWAQAHGLAAWSWLVRYPLWIARYTSASDPGAPKPWTSWAIWQWSAGGNGAGPSHGCSSTDLDLNRYRGSLSELVALRVGPDPVPVVPVPPLTPMDVGAVTGAARIEQELRGIRLNPTACLQKAIDQNGLVPVTNEFDYADASGHYVVQVAESLDVNGGHAAYCWCRETGKVSIVPI